jgi:hypothetical protein
MTKPNMRNKYNHLVRQIGRINAIINYTKRYKFDPNAQADVVYLKMVKKNLEKELKKIEK